jgi:hypothetical protein
VYPIKGEPFWENGQEPQSHDIVGLSVAPALVGETFKDFRREYEAHPDRYPTAADNIRYCELKTGHSRDDVTFGNDKPRTRGSRWV